MWTIISIAVPLVMALYGLARLQQNRSSHGAHSPAESASGRRADSYIPTRLYKADSYNQEDPNLPSRTFPATTLQSAEEKEEAARKYLVKWDSDEEGEPSANVVPLLDSALTSLDVEEKKQPDKHKQVDVKWDEFEEE